MGTECILLRILDELREGIVAQMVSENLCPIEDEVGEGEIVLGVLPEDLRAAYLLEVELRQGEELEEFVFGKPADMTLLGGFLEERTRAILMADLLNELFSRGVRAVFCDATSDLDLRAGWQVVKLPEEEAEEVTVDCMYTGEFSVRVRRTVLSESDTAD
jgi:hypothetical protein